MKHIFELQMSRLNNVFASPAMCSLMRLEWSGCVILMLISWQALLSFMPLFWSLVLLLIIWLVWLGIFTPHTNQIKSDHPSSIYLFSTFFD